MKLFASPTSPYTRLVRVVLDILDTPVELIMLNPHERPQELLAYNPLSAIPTLVLDDGTALVDSRLIMRFLQKISVDASTQKQLFLTEDDWQGLSHLELLHGAIEYTVSMAMESLMRESDHQSERVYKMAWLSIRRILDLFEQKVIELPKELDLTHIYLMVLLDYIDLRAEAAHVNTYCVWRTEYPLISAWHEAHQSLSCYTKTRA